MTHYSRLSKVVIDPIGLPFCVLPVPKGSLTDDNAQRWDG
jgi:hypothetical protein